MNDDRIPLLERLAFFLLLVVIGVRPLVGETYDVSRTAIDQALDLPGGIGPSFTLGLGSLILLSAVLLAVSRWLRPVPYRFTGFAIGFVLVVIGAAISTYITSNRRTAMTASTDWILGAAMCVLLVQLLRRPWQIRLLLGVLTASAAAFVFQCAMQRFVELPETIVDYEANKVLIWQKQGIALEDPQVTMYERRLYAREVSGYFPHPNVAGGYLLLAAFVVAAAGMVKWSGRRNDESARPLARYACGGGLLILSGLLFAAIALTGSRGAFIAGAAVLAVGAPWVWIRRRMNRTAAFVLGWLLVLSIGAGVFAYARQASPWSSMGFRWDYWRNTSAMIGDYFWTGVGAANFGSFYLRYKPVTSAEEVRDPHNFLLATMAQWGAVGMLGVLALIVGASIRLFRVPVVTPADAKAPPASAAGWAIALAVGIFGLRLGSVIGFPADYQFYVTVTPLLVWCAVFVLMHGGDGGVLKSLDSSVMPGASTLLVLGVLAFLLHAMIDITFFYPAMFTTAFAVAAVAMAIRMQGQDVLVPHRTGRYAPIVAVVMVALLLAHGLFVCQPSLHVSNALERARALAAGEIGDPTASPSLEAYRVAVQADAWDPAPPTEAAEWLCSWAQTYQQRITDSMARNVLNEASRLIHAAADRDRQNVGIYRTMTTIHAAAAQRFGRILDARMAAGAATSACNLYPASPRDRLVLADMTSQWARLEPLQEIYDEAIVQYQFALQLDAARPGEHEIRRWPETFRKDVEARLAACQAARERAATQPAEK